MPTGKYPPYDLSIVALYADRCTDLRLYLHTQGTRPARRLFLSTCLFLQKVTRPKICEDANDWRGWLHVNLHGGYSSEFSPRDRRSTGGDCGCGRWDGRAKEAVKAATDAARHGLTITSGTMTLAAASPAEAGLAHTRLLVSMNGKFTNGERMIASRGKNTPIRLGEPTTYASLHVTIATHVRHSNPLRRNVPSGSPVRGRVAVSIPIPTRHLMHAGTYTRLVL